MIERHDGGGSVIALQECVVKEVVARTAKPSVAKSDRQTASQSGRQGWMDGWMEGGSANQRRDRHRVRRAEDVGC